MEAAEHDAREWAVEAALRPDERHIVIPKAEIRDFFSPQPVAS
jgi:hypothetical protein